LWIAYGIATGSTLIAVAIGTAALLSNGSAYSNNFSTVLRIKKTMSEEILEKEGDGSEPLPKRLARARVQLGKSREQLAEKASVSSSVILIDQPEATAYSSLLRTNTRRIL
jgi:ribosome-binding protein aMBF1 (putative translation factor)